MKSVAKVAAFRDDGKMLMGRRRDDGRWCFPGGHLDDSETPHHAAHRELMEETGLRAGMLEKIATKDVKNGAVRVHAFKANVDGEPNTENDPDSEFVKFQWVDPERVPADIMGNLHSKPDVLLDALDASGPRWAALGGG